MKSIGIAAAMFAVCSGPVSAQGQKGKKASSAPPTQTQGASEPSSRQQDTSGTADKTMAGMVTDELFIKKASESNIAEIELSKMALQRASSEKVKEYAQMMVTHHTMAQLELSSLASKSTAMQASPASGASGNMGNDANDDTGIDSDNNDADKMATLGGTGGTTGNSMATGKTNGQYNSNIDNGNKEKAASGAANQETPIRDSTVKSGSSSASGATTNAGSANGTSSSMKDYLTTELSPEHIAVKNKLSILTGAEFDKQYMEVMIQDHAKSVELFEQQALRSKDIFLQPFASKNLPVVKEHYQAAQKLSSN